MSQRSRIAPHIDERWIRHDWQLWIQPNIERFMLPGVDLADVIPALARERAQQEAARERARAAEEAAFDAEIEHERRVLAALKEEMNEVNAEMARWRRSLAEEVKYSPSQPRVPRGDSRGGQWTDGSTGGSIARPMGSADVGNLGESSELGFNIAPGNTVTDGVQVADVIRVCTVAGAGRATVDGVKTHFVIYECFGGRTFRKDGLGHKFPGIVLDRFR